VSLLIIGMAAVLLMAIAVVVDASAAFLQRQGLDTVADGAALHGADFGAAGTYGAGIPEDYLAQDVPGIEAAVRDYLVAVGAHRSYPGLRVRVDVDPAAERVSVFLSAPVDLPLTVPGSPDRPIVGASGSAGVRVQR
jgi:hypothetical protein